MYDSSYIHRGKKIFSDLEVGWKKIRKAINIDGFFFQLLKAAYWSFPCWCISDLIIFQDQALKESLHEHGVKVSFFLDQ